MVVVGLLDDLETWTGTSIYYKDQSQYLYNTELYSIKDRWRASAWALLFIKDCKESAI